MRTNWWCGWERELNWNVNQSINESRAKVVNFRLLLRCLGPGLIGSTSPLVSSFFSVSSPSFSLFCFFVFFSCRLSVVSTNREKRKMTIRPDNSDEVDHYVNNPIRNATHGRDHVTIPSLNSTLLKRKLKKAGFEEAEDDDE